MARLILLTAVALAIYIGYQLLKQPSKENKQKIWQAAIILLVVILLLLAATGRLHWIGAVIGALLAGLRASWPWLKRFLPLLFAAKVKSSQSQQDNQQNNHQSNPTDDLPTSRAQALEILGLDETATEEEIIQAHRRLIQKYHPDKGGSEYIAARINKAKDILLD